MENILITGSNGLLGNALKKQLVNKQVITHTRQDCDLTNKKSVDIYFKQLKKIDTLIHCAARVGGVKANMNDNQGFFIDNFMINNNVIENTLKKKIKNVVNVLSTCIFPDNAVYPLTAEQIDNGEPHSSNFGYSYAKRLLYYATKYSRKVSGNNWISIIPTNLYGANDNFNLENSHLIPALIRKGYEASVKNEDFVVWGDGTPLRQFVYAEDMAKIILWAIDNWKQSKPMMAVNEQEYSIKQVVDIIAERFKIKTNKIKFDTSKPNGQYRKPAKTDVPSDFKFVSLEEGINKTIDWFLDNKENIRK